MRPVKKTIALLIRKPADPTQILAVRRSLDDDEHPGVWGLPAGSFRGQESVLDLIRRIGKDKLGVGISPVRVFQSGDQEREGYILQMDLWEAQIARGEPEPRKGKDQGASYYDAVEWAHPEILRDGQAKGSLCCRLGLDALGHLA